MRVFELSLLLFFTFFTNTASAITSTTFLSPIILPSFLDLHLSGEIALHPRNTAVLNATYNEKECYDCKYSGSSYGKGLGAAFRHYLNSVNENSWFGHLGIGLFEGQSKETRTGKKSVKSMKESIIQIGRRNHLQNSFFYEFSLGGVFRSNDTASGNYVGYRRSTPLINLALGINF